MIMSPDADVEGATFSPKWNYPAPSSVPFYGPTGWGWAARGDRDVGLDCPVRIWYQANYMVYA